MIITHKVSVDFVNRDSIQVVNFVQHDQNIPVLSVDLYNCGSKLEVDLSSTKIYLRVSLPNGAFSNIESTETSGTEAKTGTISTVTFGLDYSVFPAYGAAKAIILITEKTAGSTEYTNMAGSSPIVFMIDKDPIQDGSEESLDQYYGFRGYIEDVVGEIGVLRPENGAIVPSAAMMYAPQVLIRSDGKVTKPKWYPTDAPGDGMPSKDSTSSGIFVRRNASKEIMVPYKYTVDGETKEEYWPAISTKAVDAAFKTLYTAIMNPLLESLSAPNMFAVNILPATGDVVLLGAYVTQKNNEIVSLSIEAGSVIPKIVSRATSVRFKNEGSVDITVTFVMNGTYTALVVPGFTDGIGAGEKTVTLSGNMTVVRVEK